MVISDNDAVHYILDGLDGAEVNRFPRYVCYLGAGASCEAGVKSAWQICDEIRERLIHGLDRPEMKRLDNELDWDEPSLRYMSCIRRAHPDPSMRVEYFRNMLRGIGPSFAHHALALLVRHRYLKSTCITTNFDKLVESAFIQQGESECQPIRTDHELRFFLNRPDQRYIVKLHGDYDTHNILNTSDETVIIGDDFKASVTNLLTDSGLVVLGTAGFEKSVHTLFDHLSSASLKERNVLRFGLLWGVYMGRAKPAKMTPAAMERALLQRVKSEVGSDIARMIKRTHSTDRLFCFFPVWGAGRFFYDLIQAAGNRELAGESVLYLDREMRLRQVFLKAGLSDSAVDTHLKRLEPKRTHKSSQEDRSPHEEICRKVLHKGLVQLRILYGDITKRTFMASPELPTCGGQLSVPTIRSSRQAAVWPKAFS